jgi:hypothetical protein
MKKNEKPKQTQDKNPVDDELVGACLITDPQTGNPECIQATKQECRKLHGTFIGGPCGGI